MKFYQRMRLGSKGKFCKVYSVMGWWVIEVFGFEEVDVFNATRSVYVGFQRRPLESGGLESGGLESGGLESGGLESGGLESRRPVKPGGGMVCEQVGRKNLVY